jgi:HEAT repeat protein
MEPLLFLFPAVGMMAGVAYLYQRRLRALAQRQVDAWHTVAEKVGLTETDAAHTGVFGPTTTLTGRSGVLHVGLATVRRSSRPFALEPDTPLSNVITVSGMGHREGDLAIHPETFGTTVGKALGAREVELGEHGFDEKVYLEGSVPLIHALFDHETRRRVVALLLWTDATVALRDGVLRVEIPDTLDVPGWLAERVADVIEVARHLSRPADLASRLAANAQNDPVAGVRLRNLKILVREYPGRPATVAALKAALGDPNVDTRVHAAMALGDDGYETLLELASSTKDGQMVAVLAIESLGKRLPREAAEAILEEALRSRFVLVAQACLTALGDLGGSESVARLAQVLALEKGKLAETAVRALGATGEAQAEGPLLEALEHTDDAVRLAAAAALGRTGTAAAVPVLRRVAESAKEELRRAARQAVAEIQARLTGASPGQLSLTEGEAGQLSLSRDEAGRVSLPDDDSVAADGPKRRSP